MQVPDPHSAAELFPPWWARSCTTRCLKGSAAPVTRCMLLRDECKETSAHISELSRLLKEAGTRGAWAAQ